MSNNNLIKKIDNAYKDPSKRDILEYIDEITTKQLTREGIIDSKGNQIMPPPYAVGTFDKRGIPLQNKVKYMYRKILSGHSTVNVLEGGVRGGKDVFGLNVWAKVLMVSSDTLHLALGVSYEHAVKTIFDSNGFGLKYLIPHGEFLRTGEGGGIRGEFRFRNIYGKERIVMFYGNKKKDDHTKYQGFTIGTGYVNEGINQHLNGIKELQQRTATSKDRIIIISQNPVGTSHDFYTDFEKGHMLEKQEINFIKEIQQDKLVIAKWNLYLKEEDRNARKMARTYTYKYLDKLHKGKPNSLKHDELSKVLNPSELEKLYNDISEMTTEIEKREIKDEDGKVIDYGFRNAPIERFVEIPKYILDDESNKIENSSMYKIMNYDEGLENPNNVINGYDYSYFHFTMYDNIGMNEMMINDFMKGYDRKSASFKQRFLGERVSSDGILFPEFSEDNILTNPIDFYEQNPNALRFISIDPAANHPAAIVDAEVDLNEGMIYVLGESKVEMKDMDYKNRNFLKIEEELWKVIRSRKKRKMPDVLIIDPSNPFLISHFQLRGFNVVPANNKTQSANTKDSAYGDKPLHKGLKGVDLIKAGLMRLKFLFHESCVETIKEMQNVAVVFNTRTGLDDIVKINDDMFDAFKYIANTSGINPEVWLQSEVLNEYEQELLYDEEKENEKRRMENLSIEERTNEYIRRAEERRKRVNERIRKREQRNNQYDFEEWDRYNFW